MTELWQRIRSKLPLGLVIVALLLGFTFMATTAENSSGTSTL